MNKEEFLKKLRKELDILEESEINDILEEYEEYIDEKIKKGTKEIDAVKSMGNVDELASELLSAYKIKKPQEKNSINDLMSSFINIFNHIVDVFANKSFSDILRFIIEIIIIFFVVALFKIPFEIIEGVIRKAFFNLGALNIISYVLNFFIELSYLIFAMILFVKLFEKRYLKDIPLNKFKNKEPVLKNKNNVIKPLKEEKKSLIDSLANLGLVFIKFIVFWFLLGCAIYIFGMAIVIGLAIYLLIKGVTYFGVYLVIISLFSFGIFTFIVLYNFIFNRQNNHNLFLISLIINFIILGVGIGLASIEIANTSFTYENTLLNPESKEVYIDMEDNLILPRYLMYNLIIDDTLTNQIKIEYIYDKDTININTNNYVRNINKYKILYSNYDISSFKYNSKYLNNLIEDLKNKDIHSYELIKVNVYTSESNIEKLENNRYLYDNM